MSREVLWKSRVKMSLIGALAQRQVSPSVLGAFMRL